MDSGQAQCVSMHVCMCACVHARACVCVCTTIHVCVYVHVAVYCSLVAVKVGMTDHVDESCINRDTLFSTASRQLLETSKIGNKGEKGREREKWKGKSTWSEEERERKRRQKQRETVCQNEEGMKPRVKKFCILRGS